MSTPQKQYDLFVWGSTGFTGSLLCELLVRTYKPGSTTLKYCIGGRDISRMERLRKRLIDVLNKETKTNDGEDMISSIPMFVCNNDDELSKCISNSKVCLTFSGPYSESGEIVIKLCCEHYTNYVDVSGEFLWIKKMQRIYGTSVASKGLKFVMGSGFLSAVSDLGLLHLQNFAAQTSGLPCQEVLHYEEHVGHRPEPSYGTVKSIFSYIDETGEEKSVDDPYFLCNGKLCLSNIDEIINKNKVSEKPVYNDLVQSWTTPNITSRYNSSYVHFSNEEMGYPYGMDFVFSSRSLNSSYLSAVTGSLSRTVSNIVLKSRVFLEMFRCTAYYIFGEGPDVTKARGKVFKSFFVGTNMQGKSYKCTVTASDIEEYGITAITALSSCLAIIFDGELLPQTYGMSSPSCLLGTFAIKQCQDLGLQFDVEHIQ
ncbi:hypothetical protein FG386_001355 [Cryptosporidium ryanae]|uniref:uncharacterized protein n=1 Tax=Cryptosporidium ryanae TaxID=515981 RepID=UPI00351A051F|nr:hypothetical protein FG386_001355 [Cryptosporidium ryanae]